MANNPKTNCSNVFDIGQIEKLVDLMKSNELSEIVLQQGEVCIQLRRNSTQQINIPQVVHQPVMSAVAVKQEPAESKEKEIADVKSHFVTSPMVGTFYASSAPDSPPLVKVGDVVTPEKTVCLIEAMKVYNEIQAECSGKIVAILVQNGEAVEYGKPLFRIAID
ncbi:MAG: acetyl-CoA carboxylase biotin carboxyl carrier protein [Planctomycetaceae bacterium]|jgi:acetyl-CoA carboxylase biotin carboxyl carrier protein|nr:acetyl-CoA carboxylase biotin carboxyl carrier protein [Planctomycetaceae bacterium]